MKELFYRDDFHVTLGLIPEQKFLFGLSRQMFEIKIYTDSLYKAAEAQVLFEDGQPTFGHGVDVSETSAGTNLVVCVRNHGLNPGKVKALVRVTASDGSVNQHYATFTVGSDVKLVSGLKKIVESSKLETAASAAAGHPGQIMITTVENPCNVSGDLIIYDDGSTDEGRKNYGRSRGQNIVLPSSVGIDPDDGDYYNDGYVDANSLEDLWGDLDELSENLPQTQAEDGQEDQQEPEIV